MKVIENLYKDVSFDSDNQLMIVSWNGATANMEVAEFKNESFEVIDVLKKYKPKRLIVDTQNMQFPLTPELQEWSNKEIIEQFIKQGTQKIATVVSKDLFTQVSIEQAIEDNENPVFPETPFTSVEDAKKWILAEKVS